MNGLGFGLRPWNEIRISMDMLKKQGAFDGELPSFICDTDTYKWCSCAKPLVNGVCTRKRCKERVYETSSSDFLKYMTVRLPGEIAMVFGSHDGMWCVTSHETGGSMNAPVLHNDRICTGHTHPFSAYCYEKCVLGFGSSHDNAGIAKKAVEQRRSALQFGRTTWCEAHEWHVICAREATYYLRVTQIPDGVDADELYDAVLERTQQWHRWRMSSMGRKYRWSLERYMKEVLALTWYRACSGQCEPGVNTCHEVPSCGAKGDYPVFQLFVEPNIVSLNGVVYSGWELYEALSTSDVDKACQTKNADLVRRTGELYMAHMQDGQVSIIKCKRPNNIALDDSPKTRYPRSLGRKLACMNEKEFEVYRAYILRLMQQDPSKRIRDALCLNDYYRYIDLYKSEQGRVHLSDKQAANDLHLSKWFFDEYCMNAYASTCPEQKVFLLEDKRALPLLEQLRSWAAENLKMDVELHQLPSRDGRRLGLGAMCRPSEVFWKDIPGACVHQGPRLGDSWRRDCNLDAAAQIVFLGLEDLDISTGFGRSSRLRRLKETVAHELAHRKLRDVMWFDAAQGFDNHTYPFGKTVADMSAGVTF